MIYAISRKYQNTLKSHSGEVPRQNLNYVPPQFRIMQRKAAAPHSSLNFTKGNHHPHLGREEPTRRMREGESSPLKRIYMRRRRRRRTKTEQSRGGRSGGIAADTADRESRACSASLPSSPLSLSFSDTAVDLALSCSSVFHNGGGGTKLHAKES